ncbi:helix-turn-helix domain-containing protein [Cetobacterium sp.]|uniref:helix-turn-helix domain-containing protein n=1 Tax=Cetobacterium sp. TaxID=2071632 RepID=UPI003F3054F2
MQKTILEIFILFIKITNILALVLTVIIFINKYTNYIFEITKISRSELGKYIKKIREAKGISLEELAYFSKIKINKLEKIEKGLKVTITEFDLKKIANILKIDNKEFYQILKNR